MKKTREIVGTIDMNFLDTETEIQQENKERETPPQQTYIDSKDYRESIQFLIKSEKVKLLKKEIKEIIEKHREKTIK